MKGPPHIGPNVTANEGQCGMWLVDYSHYRGAFRDGATRVLARKRSHFRTPERLPLEGTLAENVELSILEPL